MTAQLAPLGQVDPACEAHKGSDNEKGEEARDPQCRAGRSTGGPHTGSGHTPARHEVLQQEACQSQGRGDAKDHPTGRGLRHASSQEDSPPKLEGVQGAGLRRRR